ncbi:hypothetical protein BDZ85DRAFT_18545 [Elsinoe ampelina]|uniref:Uncharacterized protein n=1 Tax=Elsinoe ampelina TaxID=302913 RepID=A0A6A6G730_9PEZI|nr:hypothetical protein BDZ85DRAFT_18545 [Elsinoe ampelina]
MSYTQSGTYGVSLVPGRQSSVGNNRWPSAAEAVRDMKENMKFGQKNKSPFHDWRRLWSDTIPFQVADVNQGPDLRQQVNAMTDRVQEARRRLGDRIPAGVMDSLRVATGNCILIRQGRIAANNIGELERFLRDRDPSITLVKKPYQGPDGSFEDIDYEETVRNHPGFVKQFENYHLYVWTTDVPADRNARTPDQARLWGVKTHTPPIQAIIHSANRFHGDPNCG